MYKRQEDFSDISALDIDLGNRNLVIEESEDDKTHLTYYQGKEASERIVTSANQGTLKDVYKRQKLDRTPTVVMSVSCNLSSLNLSLTLRTIFCVAKR